MNELYVLYAWYELPQKDTTFLTFMILAKTRWQAQVKAACLLIECDNALIPNKWKRTKIKLTTPTVKYNQHSQIYRD